MNPVEFGGDCVVNLLVPLGEQCYIHDSALRSVFFHGGGVICINTTSQKFGRVLKKPLCSRSFGLLVHLFAAVEDETQKRLSLVFK